MSAHQFSASIDVAVPPERLYALVSDVTRTGEWSPVCRSCWWDDESANQASGPHVGAWFTGRNETPTRTWETRSQVVVADPSREFAWEVNNGWVRWGFTLDPVDAGTRLTESWHFLPRGLMGFQERYGPEADTQVAERTDAAHRGIPETLAAIKRIAESS